MNSLLLMTVTTHYYGQLLRRSQALPFIALLKHSRTTTYVWSKGVNEGSWNIHRRTVHRLGQLQRTFQRTIYQDERIRVILTKDVFEGRGCYLELDFLGSTFMTAPGSLPSTSRLSEFGGGPLGLFSSVRVPCFRQRCFCDGVPVDAPPRVEQLKVLLLDSELLEILRKDQRVS
ncbi:hypothetical protein VNO77_37685 [Canavalia gladiata]|uniref:Uncharacterized protein n=1 Tax=Canavalia gladiata TaxID=3824 RepID=A0AAN9PUW6_CANGL